MGVRITDVRVPSPEKVSLANFFLETNQEESTKHEHLGRFIFYMLKRMCRQGETDVSARWVGVRPNLVPRIARGATRLSRISRRK